MYLAMIARGLPSLNNNQLNLTLLCNGYMHFNSILMLTFQHLVCMFLIGVYYVLYVYTILFRHVDYIFIPVGR